MDDLLLQSKEIIDKAIKDFQPYATVLMFSGGSDSLTALHVAKVLDIKLDYILHVNTRTGIPETTQFVRDTCINSGIQYIEADAGTSYEDYVLRKGFFGVGIYAHSFAYHLCKREHYGKAISHQIRQRKRNRKILLINGGRKSESRNRMITMKEPIKQDSASPSNFWISFINEWEKKDCVDFLADQKVQINPVSALLHRSGECMCGTMQSLDERKEAEFWFPEWGKWLSDLERRVANNGFLWKWGEATTKKVIKEKTIDPFQPLCVGCTNKNKLFLLDDHS